MPSVAQLEIQLAGGPAQPVPGTVAWNVYRGGPEVLLDWLETQLGLVAAPVPRSSGITGYAKVLEAVPDAVYAESLATDRWATAAELLARREELRLAGWNESNGAGALPLLSDLTRVAVNGKHGAPAGTHIIRKRLNGLCPALAAIT